MPGDCLSSVSRSFVDGICPRALIDRGLHLPEAGRRARRPRRARPRVRTRAGRCRWSSSVRPACSWPAPSVSWPRPLRSWPPPSASWPMPSASWALPSRSCEIPDCKLRGAVVEHVERREQARGLVGDLAGERTSRRLAVPAAMPIAPRLCLQRALGAERARRRPGPWRLRSRRSYRAAPGRPAARLPIPPSVLCALPDAPAICVLRARRRR